ncbi:hypothetical protein AMTRI_Chr09g37500 [Amborella trichopoda]
MKAWFPSVSMVGQQVAFGISNVLCKAAFESGLNFYTLIVYRQILATLLLFPAAYLVERKSRPSLTKRLNLQLFLLALCGITIQQNAYFRGLSYTTATAASALGNLCPAFTFVLAIIFRMERARLKSPRGQAKILGTLISLGGAMIFIFYKGYLFPPLRIPFIKIDHHYSISTGSRHGVGEWVKGAFFVVLGIAAWSLFLIFQATVCKAYPAPLSMTAWISLFATLQSLAVGLILERRSAEWRLSWDVKLWTILYTGIVISAIVYYAQMWCIVKKGPVFAAMFYPVILISAALLSAILFLERLHLGSLIGACVIVIGFYCILWGKKDECRHRTSLEDPNHNLQAIEELTPKEIATP